MWISVLHKYDMALCKAHLVSVSQNYDSSFDVRINTFYERALRIVYRDTESSFDELLSRGGARGGRGGLQPLRRSRLAPPSERNNQFVGANFKTKFTHVK